MSVTLTEKAAGEVKRIIDEQGNGQDLVLRIGVQGGGCSGFSYSLNFDTETNETRPGRRILRRPAGDGEEVRPVPRRHGHRLHRRPRPPRLRLQQPERGQELRLRQLVPGLTERPDSIAIRVGRSGAASGHSPSRFKASPGPSGAEPGIDDAVGGPSALVEVDDAPGGHLGHAGHRQGVDPRRCAGWRRRWAASAGLVGRRRLDFGRRRAPRRRAWPTVRASCRSRPRRPARPGRC